MIERKTFTTGGGTVPLLVAHPRGIASAPGIVVLQHAWGLDTFMEDRARSLAEHGYVAAAPDLFHRRPSAGSDLMARIRSLHDREILQDVDAAIAYLRELRAPHVHSIAVLGFCMGGRAAYLAAASRDAFNLALIFYGGNIRTAWVGGPSALSLTAQIGCPVLGFFGRQDKNPSPADVAAISAELARHGKPHDFRMYDAGHAFLNFNDPPRYCAHAARTAWSDCLALLNKHFMSSDKRRASRHG